VNAFVFVRVDLQARRIKLIVFSVGAWKFEQLVLRIFQTFRLWLWMINLALGADTQFV